MVEHDLVKKTGQLVKELVKEAGGGGYLTVGVKRYYWLKLKDDFFTQPVIKKLRRIAGGDTYTIIYLKMQLLSIKNEGKLFYEGVEDTFASEIALCIDEDVDNVTVAVNYLMRYGLLQSVSEEEYEYLMPEAAQNIGSETGSAIRMRTMRKKQEPETHLQEASQCDAGVTTALRTCDAPVTERREEKRREDTDREREQKTGAERPAPSPPVAEYKKVQELYNSICTTLPRCTALSESRTNQIKARFSSGFTLAEFETVFRNTASSRFLNGGNDRGWRASFDWLLKDSNFCKVLDGNYTDGTPTKKKAIAPAPASLKRELTEAEAERQARESAERTARIEQIIAEEAGDAATSWNAPESPE